MHWSKGKAGASHSSWSASRKADLEKADLGTALGSDPVVFIPGGHDVYGRAQPFDMAALTSALPSLRQEVTGFAVCAYFAVRNPEHEIAVRDLIRKRNRASRYLQP